MAEMTRKKADAYWARHFHDKAKRLEIENQRLTEALGFYADERNYDLRGPELTAVRPVEAERGARARAALGAMSHD